MISFTTSAGAAAAGGAAAVVGNWATIGPLSHHLSHLSSFILSSLPARSLLALYLLYSSSSGGASSSSSLLGGTFLIPQQRKFRQSTAILTGMVTAFCTATYLMPLMLDSMPLSNTSSSSSSNNNNGGSGGSGSGSSSNGNGNHHDIELAHVALFLLSTTSALVGAALGSLLPKLASGATLGYGMTLWIGSVSTTTLMMMTGKQQLTAVEEGGDDDADSWTTWFAMACPMAALLGGMLTAR